MRGTAMKVLNSLSGETRDCPGPLNIAQLKLIVQNAFKIALENQIILTSDEGVAWTQKTQQNDCVVVFDKSYTYNPPIVADLTQQIDRQIVEPNSTNYFLANKQFSLLVLENALQHSKSCNQLAEQCQNMQHALVVAHLSLQGHSSALLDQINDFLPIAVKEATRSCNLLLHHSNDLEILSHITLFDGSTMLSHVPSSILTVWADNCKIKYDSFVTKLQRVQQSASEIENTATNEINQPVGIDTTKFDPILSGVSKSIIDLESKTKIVERGASLMINFIDYNRILAYVNKAMSNASSDVDTQTSVRNLATIHETSYIPDIIICDESIRQATIYFIDMHQNIARHLIKRLRLIGDIQTEISNCLPDFRALQSTYPGLQQAFSQMLHVHRMGPAWAACLAEITRRRRFLKVFVQKAQAFAEILAKFRNMEIKRRTAFQEILRYIPVEIAGIAAQVPFCQITMSHTEDIMPEIKERLVQLETLIRDYKSDAEPDAGDAILVGSASIPITSNAFFKIKKAMVEIDRDFSSEDFYGIAAKSSVFVDTFGGGFGAGTSSRPSKSSASSASYDNVKELISKSKDIQDRESTYQHRLEELEAQNNSLTALLNETYGSKSENIPSCASDIKRILEVIAQITKSFENLDYSKDSLSESLIKLEDNEYIGQFLIAARNWSFGVRQRCDELEGRLEERDLEFEAADQRIQRLELELRLYMEQRLKMDQLQQSYDELEKLKTQHLDLTDELNRHSHLLRLANIEKEDLRSSNALMAQQLAADKSCIDSEFAGQTAALNEHIRMQDDLVRKVSEKNDENELLITTLNSKIGFADSKEFEKVKAENMRLTSDLVEQHDINLALQKKLDGNDQQCEQAALALDSKLNELSNVQNELRLSALESHNEISNLKIELSAKEVLLSDRAFEIATLSQCVLDEHSKLATVIRDHHVELEIVEQRYNGQITRLDANNQSLAEEGDSCRNQLKIAQRNRETDVKEINKQWSDRINELEWELARQKVDPRNSLTFNIESNKLLCDAMKESESTAIAESKTEPEKSNILQLRCKDELPPIRQSSAVEGSMDKHPLLFRDQACQINEVNGNHHIDTELLTKYTSCVMSYQSNFMRLIQGISQVCNNQADVGHAVVDLTSNGSDFNFDQWLEKMVSIRLEQLMQDSVSLVQNLKNERIAISNLQIGDVVLFLPIQRFQGWAAFNVRKHWYILDKSVIVDPARKFFLGLITHIEENSASSVGSHVSTCMAHNWDGDVTPKDIEFGRDLRRKITVELFSVGDLALFLLKRDAKAWGAFNIGTPHYFLHASVQVENKEFVLGKILHIETFFASGALDSENLYGLRDGVQYYICTIEAM